MLNSYMVKLLQCYHEATRWQRSGRAICPARRQIRCASIPKCRLMPQNVAWCRIVSLRATKVFLSGEKVECSGRDSKRGPAHRTNVPPYRLLSAFIGFYRLLSLRVRNVFFRVHGQKWTSTDTEQGANGRAVRLRPVYGKDFLWRSAYAAGCGRSKKANATSKRISRVCWQKHHVPPHPCPLPREEGDVSTASASLEHIVSTPVTV
jgi:hypothetical protein